MIITGVRFSGNRSQKKGRIVASMIASLDRAGAQVAWVAVQIAPEDTGFLKSTITSTPPEPAGDMPYHYLTRIGPWAYYGGYQELGTSLFPAQPYMRPALQVTRADLVTDLRRSVIEASNNK